MVKKILLKKPMLHVSTQLKKAMCNSVQNF